MGTARDSKEAHNAKETAQSTRHAQEIKTSDSLVTQKVSRKYP